MVDFTTAQPTDLPLLAAISPDAVTIAQEPGGPPSQVTLKLLLGRLISTETIKETADAVGGDPATDLAADLDHDANTVALVYLDPSPAKNGWWRKTGATGVGGWIQFEKLSAYAAEEVQAAISRSFDWANAAPGVAVDPAGHPGKESAFSERTKAEAAKTAVEALFTSLSLVTLDPATGYIFGIGDPVTARYALLMTAQGRVEIGDLLLGQVIDVAQLKDNLRSLLLAELDPASGYIYGIGDAVSGRYALLIAADGSVEIGSLKVAEASFGLAALDSEAKRLLLSTATDTVAIFPDGWHDTEARIAARAAPNGSFWRRVAPLLTPSLRGINGSGVSLDFRKSARLPWRGTRYIGTFDPGPTGSTSFRGTFSPALPNTAGAAVGDYWRFGGRDPVVLGGNAYSVGDLAVWTGAALVRQIAPAPLGGSDWSRREPGDWWNVTAAGAFDGFALAIGDRVVNLGVNSQSAYAYAIFTRGDHAGRGELFYRGEFAPSGGVMPAGAIDGDGWQASDAGNAGGIAWTAGDYAVREDGIWGRIPGGVITTVAAGAYAFLPCVRCASEWEVRRTDKANAALDTYFGAAVDGAMLKVRRASVRRRADDRIYLISDSLYGVNGVGQKMLDAVGRVGVVNSMGSGESDELLSRFQQDILDKGDPYGGWTLFPLQGQNNQPIAVGDEHWTRIFDTALRFEALAGARDIRVGHTMIPGTHRMVWNGARLANPQLEDWLDQSGILYKMDANFRKLFPGRIFSMRDALLAAALASNVPDLQYPGKTEAQVAALYGIIPLRFYNGWLSLPQAVQDNPASLNFVGYRSVAGLPAGGADNDYYLRSAGGAQTEIGNIIVRQAGVWTEPPLDTIHMSLFGASAVSDGFKTFLSAISY